MYEGPSENKDQAAAEHEAKASALFTVWREGLMHKTGEGVEAWLDRWEGGLDRMLQTSLLDLAGMAGVARGVHLALSNTLGYDQRKRLEDLIDTYAAEINRRIEAGLEEMEAPPR